MIAALFVESHGPYSNLDNIDVWDIKRDAKKYNGPHKVIAHPPCARWGRYWSGGPSAKIKRKLGDDDGCFKAAITAVRKYGGILEHPEASHAWAHFGLIAPQRDGGWIAAGDFIGWTCCVEQGHYGHKARKATWLYAVGCDLPSLKWGPCNEKMRMDEGFHSAEERKRAIKPRIYQRLSKHQRILTPVQFRDLLISIVGKD